MKKKSLLGCCTGESPYLDRAVSSPVGRMSLNVCRVETDLFFLDSLSSYQFDGQRLALLTFYLTTFAPSWPVLKCLLAMAFFFSFKRQRQWVGENSSHSALPCPPPPTPEGRPWPWGPAEHCLRGSGRTEKLTAWVPELVLTLLLLCKLQIVSYFSFFKLKSFLTLPCKYYFFLLISTSLL